MKINKDKIALLLGTRCRPHNIHRFVDSVYKTRQCDYRDIEIIFYVDYDDTMSLTTIDEISTFYEGVKYCVGPRVSLNKMPNECYKLTDASIIGFFGDDFVFRTEHWDKRVRQEFDKLPTDKIGLIFGNDLYNKETATHGFLHRNWIETIGYVTPEEYDGDYGDTHLTDIAKRIDRLIYLDDVIFEHMHWSVKNQDGSHKAEQDNVYVQKNMRGYGGPIPCNVLYEQSKEKRIKESMLLLDYIYRCGLDKTIDRLIKKTTKQNEQYLSDNVWDQYIDGADLDFIRDRSIPYSD